MQTFAENLQLSVPENQILKSVSEALALRYAFSADIIIYVVCIIIIIGNTLHNYLVSTAQIVSPVSEYSFPATSPKNSIDLNPIGLISDFNFSFEK